MEKKKILITDRFSQEALLMLKAQNFLTVEKTESHELYHQDLKGVHGLIIRSRTQITDEILSRAKQLQVIITATSGFDHIDLEATRKWGITVMYTPEANVESAAQMTWALNLACANKLTEAHRQIKGGSWRRETLIGRELYQKTYGIVGLGRIGRRVADIALAFGMKVIAYDPYIDESSFSESGAERVAYEEILKRSDLISFHVPRTEETHHMLNRSHFEYINREVILVNTSRASVIHELDLCEALEKNYIAAVGLDVFEKEPLPRTSKLFNFPQVVMAPHLGANTEDAFLKASEQAALKLSRFFMDGSTADTLPPKASWYLAAPAWAKKNSSEANQ